MKAIHKFSRRRSGFTLAELLIVIAIISVLVAIAIPVFGTALEKSRAAVCTANRRSLKSVLAVSQLLESYSSLEDAYTHIGAGETSQYTCPSGGTISVRGNSISCSKHGVDGELSNIAQAQDKLNGATGYNAIRKYYANNGGKLPELTKDQAFWTELFGDKALYQNPETLYWRPSSITVDGKTEYIMFASNTSYADSGANNSGVNANWGGYACYYNGTYYVSEKEAWNHSIDNLNVGGYNSSAGTVEQWLISNNWKAVER